MDGLGKQFKYYENKQYNCNCLYRLKGKILINYIWRNLVYILNYFVEEKMKNKVYKYEIEEFFVCIK